MDIAKQIVDNQARNLVKESPELFSEYADEYHKISTAFFAREFSVLEYRY